MESKKPLTLQTELGAFGGEAFYKTQLELANKEKAQLQERLREVETKNAFLLKSLFELSVAPPGTTAAKAMPLDIVTALKKMSLPAEQPPGLSGKGSAYRRTAPLDRVSMEASFSGVGGHINTNFTPFRYRGELKGHASAVYTIQYSPSGQLLASTSFDRRLCIWSMDRFLEKSNYAPKLSISDAHRGPCVAVEWGSHSARVVTGGLDQSAAVWDVDSARYDPVSRYLCNGLVNSVSISPANDELFLVGTSRNSVHLFDRRVEPEASGAPWGRHTLVDNDCPVNSIHVTLDGNRVITGDHGGAIKTYDLRKVGPGKSSDVGARSCSLTDVTYNDANHRPITHVHTSPPTSVEDYGRFMAVNSYDNFLRVYDRGSSLLKGEKPELKAVHALSGIKNTHWPIKSSFFMGSDYRPPSSGSKHRRQRRARESSKASTTSAEGRGVEDEDRYASSSEGGDELSYSSSSEAAENEAVDEEEADEAGTTIGGPIQNSLILASGSADGNICLFDVGGRPGTGALLQTLEGHKDRVYGVDFHPNEPILASCSADCGIKIWQSFR
ncbi:unnamed protein product [Chondrus crispus]|uniref:Uncharacterized protein n=1 Tax=Chondrus crispus TaxID=2769 RepID=R7QRT1_CHOCR|nr:unnamed protein product [Chondrus crispus]CDF40849.1 unnamed protein product [Chondrus crispus]|eukprot:XP_005711143.1 unnamed protein product [Chondrus crispus]